MLVVVGKKLYDGTYNEQLKGYPQLRVILKKDGSVAMERQETALPKLPKVYHVCAEFEAIARFGEPEVDLPAPLVIEPEGKKE